MKILFLAMTPGFLEVIVLCLIGIAAILFFVKKKKAARVLAGALLSFLVATFFTPADLLSTLILSVLIFGIFLLGIWTGKKTKRTA